MSVQKPGIIPGMPHAPESSIMHATVPPPWVSPRGWRCHAWAEVSAGGHRECGETHPKARPGRAAKWAHFCPKKELAAPSRPPRRYRGRHPSTPRPRPTLLSFGHAPAAGVNGRQRHRPLVKLTGASTNRCPACCPATNQSMEGAGRLSLPGRSSPQWARPPPWPAVPVAAYPLLEPCSASFSQSLQCSWSFSSAAGREGLAGGRLTAVSLSSAILNGASARAAPPQQSSPRLAGVPRGMPGVVVCVGLRGPGCAWAGTTIPVRSLWVSRGGPPVAGGLPPTEQPRGCPGGRRATTRSPARPFPAEAAVLASPRARDGRDA